MKLQINYQETSSHTWYQKDIYVLHGNLPAGISHQEKSKLPLCSLAEEIGSTTTAGGQVVVKVAKSTNTTLHSNCCDTHMWWTKQHGWSSRFHLPTISICLCAAPVARCHLTPEGNTDRLYQVSSSMHCEYMGISWISPVNKHHLHLRVVRNRTGLDFTCQIP